MSEIVLATIEDAALITEKGKESFMESHLGSSPEKDLLHYVQTKYNTDTVSKELSQEENLFYLIYEKEAVAGYSKLVLNVPHPDLPQKNLALLDRLYLMKSFYGRGLGKDLFLHNIRLCEKLQVTGVWLAVWVGNMRAIAFYERFGFKTFKETGFKITDTHINPCLHMYFAL